MKDEQSIRLAHTSENNMDEKDTRITERLISDYNKITELGHEVLGVFLYGSYNYELGYAGSDIDTRCVILPSLEDLILNRQPVSTTVILEDDSHIELKDIRLLWRSFKRQNISFLEVLFTKFYYVPEKYQTLWQRVLEIREDIAHIDRHLAVNCIANMVLEKSKNLCHPYPTLLDKIEKYGYDNKQLHHCLRCRQLLDRYISGEPFASCLIANDRQELIEVKSTYKYSVDEAVELATATAHYAVHTKQQYLFNAEHVVDELTPKIMDDLMVEILKAFYKSIF